MNNYEKEYSITNMLEEEKIMFEKLKEKYVFFDIDGTLSEYRYDDILYGGRCHELGCQSLENLLFSNLFYTARPLKNMQKIIQNLDSEKIFILGAITTNNELDQKYLWLKENYPNIKRKHIFFISSTMLKPEVIMGITAYHPSSFVE